MVVSGVARIIGLQANSRGYCLPGRDVHTVVGKLVKDRVVHSLILGMAASWQVLQLRRETESQLLSSQPQRHLPAQAAGEAVVVHVIALSTLCWHR